MARKHTKTDVIQLNVRKYEIQKTSFRVIRIRGPCKETNAKAATLCDKGLSQILTRSSALITL